MTHKKKYIAPVLFEEIMLELEGGILQASKAAEKDPNFESVETMGQEIGGNIEATDWSQTW